MFTCFIVEQIVTADLRAVVAPEEFSSDICIEIRIVIGNGLSVFALTFRRFSQTDMWRHLHF